MYSRLNMDDSLQKSPRIADKHNCVYGDAAYRLRPWLCTAYFRQSVTKDQVGFKKAMNTVRTCVKWSYGEVKQLFTAFDFRRAKNLREAPIAQLYVCTGFFFKFVCAWSTEDRPRTSSWLGYRHEMSTSVGERQSRARCKRLWTGTCALEMAQDQF